MNACPTTPTSINQDVSIGTNQRISNPLLIKKVARMNKIVVGKVLRVRLILALIESLRLYW